LIMAALAACASSEVPSPSTQIGQSPLCIISFAVDSPSRQPFLKRSNAVADARGFAYAANQVTPDYPWHLVEILSPDFRILVGNDMNTEVFDLTVYENQVRPVPAKKLHEFLAAFASAAQSIPGVRMKTPTSTLTSCAT